MANVLREITPLTEKDCFYIAERHKSEFLYPLHSHSEFELNFIENGAGVRRVVGDSVEEIGPLELTLIAGNELEHVWEQGSCTSADVREITIQFPSTLFSTPGMDKSQFDSIREMLSRAGLGLTFGLRSIMKVYPLLDTLAHEREPFDQYLHMMKILYDLSQADDSRVLASSAYARGVEDPHSRRVQKVKHFIQEHFSEAIHLDALASIAGMAPSAFSRFFRQQTGRTVVDYITDVRVGNAARLLIDSSDNVSQICYSCGFNNLSNFNRIFKSKRGYTPRDFRALYKKTRVFI